MSDDRADLPVPAAADLSVAAAADLSIAAAVHRLADGLSAEALLDACLHRIRSDEALGAFLHVAEASAREAARQSDLRRAAGAPRSALDGIPIALKDLLVTNDMPTTAASRILDGWRAPYDGEMARRLRAAGAVLVGKTNLDEFAMGSSTERSAFFPCQNPWDRTRVPGGSSGGSAAAVAAGQALGSLGTDTGGSIRQPAAFCGIFGLKPTYGRVSRAGVIAFASSLDQVGPLGRSAQDLALLLGAIAGFDKNDATSSERPVDDYLGALQRPVRGLRVGLPAEYFGAGVDPEIEAAVRATADRLEEDGAILVPVHLPHTALALSTYYVLSTAEAASNLARYDGVRYGRRAAGASLDEMVTRTRFEGFGEEVRRRIVLGTYVASAGYRAQSYERAQRVRTLIRRDFEQVFERCDVLLAPTTPTAAFSLGEKTDDPLEMYAADVLTLAVNLSGIPALSAPAGFTESGLPIGAQLMGPWFEEGRLLTVAHAVERGSDFAQRRPPPRPG